MNHLSINLTRSLLWSLLLCGLSSTAFGASQSEIQKYYRIETIKLPAGEHSVDAVAFMPDGRLVCCLSFRRIYFYEPKADKWSLFAKGLHQPLGIWPISNSEIYVAQRPELTLVRDTNGDGKADHYKTVSDFFGMSGNYAEWAFGPVADAKGSLYFSLGTGSNGGGLLTDEVRGKYSRVGHEGRMNSSVPYRGWVMKVTPDGKTIPWASGLRQPNGLGFDLNGNLFTPDNQGDWIGTSKLFHIREGGFYGHAHSLVWHPDFVKRHPFKIPVAELDRLRTRAAVVFPHGEMANSPSQPLCDTTQGRFGPFAGQMFIGEMNHKRIMRVMLEEVDGKIQGACTPFFDNAGLELGSNRLAFDPDGRSLWVGHTKYGFWTGASALQRITWTGKTPFEVQEIHLTKTGFDLLFTKPVNPATASRPQAYTVKRYTYNYHEAYGSKKYDDTAVKITAVSVHKDRRRVSLTLEELKAWHVHDLRFKGIVSADDGSPVVNPWLVYNVNRLVANTPPPPAPRKNKQPGRKTPRVPAGGVKSIGGPQSFGVSSEPIRD